MLFFFQMGEDQALPVPIQLVFTCRCKKLQSASSLPRFQKKMHFRIMTQWFKMAYAFHRCGNGFFIYNISGSEFHSYMKTFPDEMFQNLYLYLTHEHGMDFSQLLIPHNMKLWFFLFQLFQAFQHLVGIVALRKDDLIVQHRLQNRHDRLPLNTQALSRIGFGKACYRTDGSCLRFFEHLKLRTGINADLIHFFLPDLFVRNSFSPCIGKGFFYFQASTCDLHVSEAVALVIPGNLENLCPEFRWVNRCRHVGFHTADERIHAFHFQGRTKETGKKLPLQDQSGHIFFHDNASVKKLLHKRLFTHGNIFQKFICSMNFASFIHRTFDI